MWAAGIATRDHGTSSNDPRFQIPTRNFFGERMGSPSPRRMGSPTRRSGASAYEEARGSVIAPVQLLPQI
jgi:hypothetical protein